MPKDTSKPVDMLATTRKTTQRVTQTVLGTHVSTSSTTKSAAKKLPNLPLAVTDDTSTSPTKRLKTSISSNETGLILPLEVTILSLEKDTMGESWYEVLKEEFGKDYFTKLKKFLAVECGTNTVYPPLKDVYSWSRLTPFDSVKVVILGQDPYHNVGQAHGLSFSVLPPTKLPGSLKNIYKQLQTDVPAFVIPASGDLTPLASLGVLWLNTSLTVRAHKAASHKGKGWEKFTEVALRTLLARTESSSSNGSSDGRGRGVVFMAWGLPAQKTCEKLGIDETKHLVLKSAHPSPLSAYRGFLGNGHFRQANEWLKERYGAEAQIDWGVLGREI